MRIVLATLDSLATLQGGVEAYVHRLALALQDRGHEVTVAARRPPGAGAEATREGVRYRFAPLPPLPSGHRTRLLLERPFDRALARLAAGVDVVHGQNADGVGALGVAPVVATIHTTPLDEWPSSRLGGWREALYQRHLQAWTLRRWRRFVPRAARLFATGDHVARSLRELGAPKVDVVPNPVDPVPRLDPAEARARLALPPGPLVLYLGRLAAVKRVERAIDAVAAMPGTRLVVAGEGPEAASLRRRAGPLGERVRFVGRVDDAHKALLLNAADALVLPSEHEGQPLVLLEALSVGLPAVATRAEWLPPELRAHALVGEDVRGLLEKALARGRGPPARVETYAEAAARCERAYETARGAAR